MVAVEVRDEDVRDAIETDMQASHLQLRALATVHQKELVVYVDHLRRSLMPHRRRGRSTAEDGDIEGCHIYKGIVH